MPEHQLKIHSYQKSFPAQFAKVKAKLVEVLPASSEIEHIGSTAIPGLGGKGIIDVLIALPNWHREKKIIADLQKIGYEHLHPRKDGHIFLSPVAETRKGDSHLHLVLKKSANYRNLLKFRNQLRRRPKLLREYQEIKNKLAGENKNRAEYGKLKADFIKRVIENN